MKNISIGIAFISLILLVTSCNQSPSRAGMAAEEQAQIQPTLAYGIPIDSMLVITEHVKRNQFLSDILLNYNVDYQTIDILAKRSKPTFDVRKIRAGNRYSVMCTNDSLKKVEYFVYEISPTNYVVFDLRDSVHVHLGEKEIEVRENTTSGTISSSLWNAMVENQTDPNLANELSEIYAWTIDFFGIQKGDSYKVIYEELFVEDEFIGIGKVHAAWFYHAGHDFYSFYFVQDSIGDYFDESANSMRRTFLKAPLRFSRISSRFSNSRLHPVLKIRRPHHGVDYAAAVGTPVYAIGDGVVIEAQYRGQNGRIVKIKHNGTYTTAYLHLSKFGKGIKSGVHVTQGQVIGYVGSTGLSTGPHLDFRFYKNGHAVDPLKVESPPAEPVDSANLDGYYQMVKHFKTMLDSMQVVKSSELAAAQ
ncbi:MAG: peptidoglycan DD-metalloendopeptidase family protein [Bacteroidetes bacterium]|nr:peptidoglycan DD-metalloendopeptidase family protein [Bacteroidota bacterium]